MEAYVDSSVIFDSLEDVSNLIGVEKKEDRIAIEKIANLKIGGSIDCYTIINIEFQIAKDDRQDAIEQKWGKFLVKDIGIGLNTTLKTKYYDPRWERRLGELIADRPRDHIDMSIFTQAEYFDIKYIISTDYNFIKHSKDKSKNVEVIRPIRFVKNYLRLS